MSVEIFINIPLEVLGACNPFTPTLSKTTWWIRKGVRCVSARTCLRSQNRMLI